MAEFESQTFEYAGSKYKLVIELLTGDGKISQSLDNNQLEMIEFDSEFNKLVSDGSFIYNDGYGHINRFLEKQECYIQMHFSKLDFKEDGALKSYQPNRFEQFNHGYLIQNIEILKREDTYIKYRFTFTSLNIYKCLATIDYSNYGSSEKSVFKIFQACLKLAGLGVDEESFNMVQTQSELNYITNGNDNIFSIFKYLFNRLYSVIGVKDDSLKFILWDIFENKYKLFDVKNEFQLQNKDKLILSMMKSDQETMIEPERVKLGSVTQYTTGDLINTFLNAYIDVYEYNENEFWKSIIQKEKMISYVNTRPDNAPNIIDKRTDYQGMPYNIFPFKRGTLWNNDFNFYQQLLRSITKNNALLVEVSGRIRRQPGYVVDVKVDRSNTNVDDESLIQQKDYFQRFRGFEGPWIIYRVRNVIEFNKKTFRQKLTLIRNFTIDMVKTK